MVLGHRRPREARRPIQSRLPSAFATDRGRRAPCAGRRAGRPASPGVTSSPPSPTTSGRAPVSLTTTGTPDAIASTATRQNCSRHPGLGSRGDDHHVERPVDVRKVTLVDESPKGDPVRESQPRGQRARASAWGPAPMISSVASGMPLIASIKTSTPLWDSNRPT